MGESEQTPPAEGQSAASESISVEAQLKEMQEKLAQVERQRDGILNDLRHERKIRQDLESQSSSRPVAGNQPSDDSTEAVVEDEGIAKLILPTVQKALKPLVEREQLREKKEKEKEIEGAYDWLAKSEGKSVEEVMKAKVDQEVVEIAGRYNLTHLSPLEGTKAAYKILKAERLAKKAEEEERAKAIASNNPSKTVSSKVEGAKVWTKKEIAALSTEEFLKHKADILQQERSGSIK